MTTRTEFESRNRDFVLVKSDVFAALSSCDFRFDMVFADPPYFLSNDGLTVKNGEVVSVNKGHWDKSPGRDAVVEFYRSWLSLVRKVMKRNSTIWISGTAHNIFIIGQLLTELGFKVLNVITWEKTNPPPNFSCRYFTHSTEQVIWARKEPNVPHVFNYELMKAMNGGKQMKDVWKLPAIGPWEKVQGKHPTQKPLSLLSRIILASTAPRAWVLDPFAGSSTTGIAANLFGRNFAGIDNQQEYIDLSRARREAIEKPGVSEGLIDKIQGLGEEKQFLSSGSGVGSGYLKGDPNPMPFQSVEP